MKACQLAGWVLVLLTLFQLCWLQFRPGSGLSALMSKVTGSYHEPSVVSREDQDQMIAHSKTGNVFMRLIGNDNTNAVNLSSHDFFDYREYYFSDWYFLACYTLYPRRVFLAPTNVVINDGWDVMRVQFAPDNAWLGARNVHSILTVGFDHDGKALPGRWMPVDAETETPTNGWGGGR